MPVIPPSPPPLLQIRRSLLKIDLESHGMRAELSVQETLAAIPRATTLKRLETKEERQAARTTLAGRNETIEMDGGDAGEVALAMAHINGEARDTAKGGRGGRYDSMSTAELTSLCSSLDERLSEPIATANRLEQSSKHITSRLMDYCNSDGVEFRISAANQEELFTALDEFVENLPEEMVKPSTPGYDEDYAFGSDEYDENVNPLLGGSSSGKQDTDFPSQEVGHGSEVVSNDDSVKATNSATDNPKALRS